MTDAVWEAYAIRYGTIAKRTRRECFMGLDPHDADPKPLDYFVWALRSDDRVVVVDTGFDRAEGERLLDGAARVVAANDGRLVEDGKTHEAAMLIHRRRRRQATRRCPFLSATWEAS